MAATSEDGFREQALKRLRKRRALVRDVAAYVCVNALLVIIWGIGDRGYFWPGWVLGIWGFFLLLDVWSAWGPFIQRPITDEDVDREVERLRRRSGGGAAAA